MNSMPNRELCLKCKGRGYCNLDYCPAYEKIALQYEVHKSLEKENFSSSAPGVFVGRFGYPHLNVGILTPPEAKEDAWLYDAPRFWGTENFQIQNVIQLRSSLINSRFKLAVRDKSRFLESAQEVAMASKPVAVDITLQKKPNFRVSFEPTVAPMGANAALKEFVLTENPRIPTKIDKIVSDTDLLASKAILELRDKRIDESVATRLLSIGALGVKFERRLVPTRWSITAVDDISGKNYIDEIKQYDQLPYTAFFGGYLGNYFLVLCFSETWSYELFETFASMTSFEPPSFTTDFEGYQGRKSYAENCAGGYYASRLSVLEKLAEMKKQASILVLRFITGEYWAPLGVWVVREAVRKAMSNQAIEFDSQELMLRYAELLLKKKFNYNANFLLKESKMLKEIKSQTKLTRFL